MRILGESFYTHRFAWNKLDNSSITRLDELGIILGGLTCTTINLLLDLGELARNMCSVTVQDRAVSVGHLARMVENNDLCSEILNTRSWLFLESEQTYPLLMSLTDTFLMLKPTLSPGTASGRDSWCISTDFTSVVSWLGANVTTMPGLIIPVSTRPTGTVPIPPILYTS